MPHERASTRHEGPARPRSRLHTLNPTPHSEQMELVVLDLESISARDHGGYSTALAPNSSLQG
jgi:hypothetical protein